MDCAIYILSFIGEDKDFKGKSAFTEIAIADGSNINDETVYITYKKSKSAEPSKTTLKELFGHLKRYNTTFKEYIDKYHDQVRFGEGTLDL